MMEEMYGYGGGSRQPDLSPDYRLQSGKFQGEERTFWRDQGGNEDEIDRKPAEMRSALNASNVEKEDALIRFLDAQGIPAHEAENAAREAKRKLGLADEDYYTSAKHILSGTKMDAAIFMRFQKIIHQATLLINVVGKNPDGSNPLQFVKQEVPVPDPQNPGKQAEDSAGRLLFKEVYAQEIAPLEIQDQLLRDNYVVRLGDVVNQAKDAEKLAGRLGLDKMKGIIAELIKIDLDYQIIKLDKKIEDLEIDYKDQRETLVLKKDEVVRKKGELSTKITELSHPHSMDVNKVFQGMDPFVAFTEVAHAVNDWMVTHKFGNESNPKYFEDILGLIMLTYGAEYGFDGEKKLMDREGKVYFHNFLKWIEEQMYYFSDFQDDDSFSGYQFIAFYTVFRQISLFEMIVTEPQKYFSKKGIRAKNRDTGETEYFHDDSDPRYKNLRNYLVSLITPANVIHDSDVEYTKNIETRGEDFLNMMKKFYGSQALTFNSRLLRFMSLLSTDEDEVEEFLTSDRKQNRIGGKLGRAMSGALLLHYHLDQLGHQSQKDGELRRGNSDFIDGLGRDDEWEKINGIDKLKQRGGRSSFFQSLIYQSITKSKYAMSLKFYGGRAQAIGAKTLEDDRMATLLTAYEQLLSRCEDKDHKDRTIKNSYTNILEVIKKDLNEGDKSVLRRMYGLTGKDTAKLAEIKNLVNNTTMNRADLEQELAFQMLQFFHDVSQKDLNFYNAPKAENRSIRNIVNEAIEASIQAEFNLNHTDAQFGSHFVSLMPSFMGIGAKNDTAIDSTQWWATVMQFREYRIRNPKKVDVGDPETFNTIDQFLTFMEAIPVEMEAGGGKRISVPFYEFIKAMRDKRSLITQEGIKAIRDEYGLSDTDYPDPNMIGDPAILSNSMKNFVSQHLKGMVDIDGIIKKHKFDLMDVMRQESGTGKWVEDAEKTDNNFFKLLGALRNIISKPSFSAYLESEEFKVLVRENILDADGKATGKYRFVRKTLAEKMLHRNVRTTLVDQLPDKNGKNTIDGKETLVKQMIKHLVTLSYERHKFKLLGGLTEADRQRESKWSTWTPERFMATDYFLMYNLLAEAMQYKEKYGAGMEDFIEVFHQVKGYFSKGDIADTHKVSHTEYWGKWYALGMGGMYSNSIYFGLLGAIWLAMIQQISHGVSDATKFK